jgi:hypothetical protein
MKNIIYIMLIVFLGIGFVSCEKDTSTEDISEVTYYVDIQLEGEHTMVVPKGSDFSDPGFVAVENDADVTSDVTVEGEVDTDQVGLYALNYTAYNGDNFATEESRTIIVYDPTAPEDDLSGSWDGNRVGLGGGVISISKLGPGIFEVSDLFGGYYEFIAGGEGYGSAYRLSSIIQLNADYTYVSLTNSSPWGPWEVLDGVYDPASQVMSHTNKQGTFSFDVVLTKK